MSDKCVVVVSGVGSLKPSDKAALTRLLKSKEGPLPYVCLAGDQAFRDWLTPYLVSKGLTFKGLDAKNISQVKAMWGALITFETNGSGLYRDAKKAGIPVYVRKTA